MYFKGYLAAMGTTGGGRNNVDPRFIAMFSIYNVTFPSDETLNYIYMSILAGHFEIFPENIQQIADILIRITLQLYKVMIYYIYSFHIFIPNIKKILFL